MEVTTEENSLFEQFNNSTDQDHQLFILAKINSILFNDNNIDSFCTLLDRYKNTDNLGITLQLISMIDSILCVKKDVPMHIKSKVVPSSIQFLNLLIPPSSDSHFLVIKHSLITCSNIFPLAFSLLCVNSLEETSWQAFTEIKNKVHQLFYKSSDGVKVCCIKFLHVVVLIQSSPSDFTITENINLDNFSESHPFVQKSVLNKEVMRSIYSLYSLLQPGSNSSLVCMSACLSCIVQIAKQRHQFTAFIIPLLVKLSQNLPKRFPPFELKSIQKTLKINFLSILRANIFSYFADTITETLDLNLCARSSEINRARQQANLSPMKRSAPSFTSNRPRKRTKIINSAQISSAAEDIKKIPVPIVIEVILRSLQNCSIERWNEAVADYEQSLAPTSSLSSDDIPPPKKFKGRDPRMKNPEQETASLKINKTLPYINGPLSSHPNFAEYEDETFKEGDLPLSPIKVKTEKIEEEDDDEEIPTLEPSTFELKQLTDLTDAGKKEMSSDAFQRILECESVTCVDGVKTNTTTQAGSSMAVKAGWEVLVSRIASRVAVGDDFKKNLLQRIFEDFKKRYELAISWLHEECLNSEIEENMNPNTPSSYQKWLYMIISQLETWYKEYDEGTEKGLSNKDPIFAKFLVEIPQLTEDDLSRFIEPYCLDKKLSNIGIHALLQLILHRPSSRIQARSLLLSYCVYNNKQTRTRAIITSKKLFGSDRKSDSLFVEKFALESLGKLLEPPKAGLHEMQEADGPEEPLLWTEESVLCHIQLFLSLCSKKPDLLIELFKIYPRFDPTVQKVVRNNIDALIASMSSGSVTSPHLVNIVSAFPDGSDSLILKMLVVSSEKCRPSNSLISAVKHATVIRKLDARFTIPIVSFLPKNEILAFLPKLLQLIPLEGSALLKTNAKNKVKEVLEKILNATALQNGIAVQKVSPAEILVCIQNLEEVIGLKLSIEATQICLKMPIIRKQEILGETMKRIILQSKIPKLFMRTVIQSMRIFEGLKSIVLVVLKQLISKKIWTDKGLWEGYIVCCDLQKPASFPVFLSLPKEQIANALELSDKRAPNLKGELYKYIRQLPPVMKNSSKIQYTLPLVAPKLEEGQLE